jgi:hypothetical protein
MEDGHQPRADQRGDPGRDRVRRFGRPGGGSAGYDSPLRCAGRLAQRLRNWALRKRPPLKGLDNTLLEQRNEIRATLGRQRWHALLLAAGRLRSATSAC